MYRKPPPSLDSPQPPRHGRWLLAGCCREILPTFTFESFVLFTFTEATASMWVAPILIYSPPHTHHPQMLSKLLDNNKIVFQRDQGYPRQPRAILSSFIWKGPHQPHTSNDTLHCILHNTQFLNKINLLILSTTNMIHIQ